MCFCKKTLVCSVLGVFMLLGAAQDELVRFRDNGFESWRKKYNNPYWWQLVQPGSAEFCSDGQVKHSGRYSLKIVPSGNEARVKYLRGIFKTHPGRVYTFSVWAKGDATLNFEVRQWAEIPGNVGSYRSRKLKALLSKDYVLTPEWKQYSFTFSGKDPALLYMEMQFLIRGKGKKAYLDDTGVTTLAKSWNQFGMGSAVVVEKGKTAHFSTSGTPPAGGVALLPPVLAKINGKTTLPVIKGSVAVKAPDRIGCYPFAVVHEDLKDGRRHYIHVVESAQYKRLEQLASAVCINPGKVLVLGDSLSDYLRGYNWAAVVDDFCRKRFPGKVQFYNFAVGGDHAPRMLDRLKEVRGTYALDRYKGIRDVKPDHILISLGQNDTLSLDRSKGAASPVQVPEEKFAACIREMVTLLRKHYPGAKIVLFTPYTMCIEKTRKHFFGNRKLMYGQPEIVLRYVNLVKQLGRELNCSVLDVYTPFKQLQDRGPYFMPDGIHLSLKGNFYAAEQVLRFFGEKKSVK